MKRRGRERDPDPPLMGRAIPRKDEEPVSGEARYKRPPSSSGMAGVGIKICQSATEKRLYDERNESHETLQALRTLRAILQDRPAHNE